MHFSPFSEKLCYNKHNIFNFLVLLINTINTYIMYINNSRIIMISYHISYLFIIFSKQTYLYNNLTKTSQQKYFF